MTVRERFYSKLHIIFGITATVLLMLCFLPHALTRVRETQTACEKHNTCQSYRSKVGTKEAKWVESSYPTGFRLASALTRNWNSRISQPEDKDFWKLCFAQDLSCSRISLTKCVWKTSFVAFFDASKMEKIARFYCIRAACPSADYSEIRWAFDLIDALQYTIYLK